MSQLVFPQQAMIKDMVRSNGRVKIWGNIEIKRDLNVFSLPHSVDR